jgi:hypothetical protein
VAPSETIPALREVRGGDGYASPMAHLLMRDRAELRRYLDTSMLRAHDAACIAATKPVRPVERLTQVERAERVLAVLRESGALD